MPNRPHDPPLPRGWTTHVRSAFLHAIGLASMALTVARGRADGTRRRSARLAADLERAEEEIALPREELAVKDARWSRLDSKRRPHFSPTERMRVLALRTARGWSLAEAAARLQVNDIRRFRCDGFHDRRRPLPDRITHASQRAPIMLFDGEFGPPSTPPCTPSHRASGHDR